MNASNAGRALALVFADELARAGVNHVCLSPGARSTPLALALAEEPRLEHHVILDERSAGFVAVGIAKATRRPAAVLCTSGTAAANLHPAIIEAHHARVPLVALTADRPAELRDTGAPQTVDQIKLFGGAVRWFFEVGVPEERGDSVGYWRSVAARACATAARDPAGPVHLNLAFREPLGRDPDARGWTADLSGGPQRAPWTMTHPGVMVPPRHVTERLAADISSAARGAIVAGAVEVEAEPVFALAEAAGWPVLAEPASNLRRGRLALSAHDALLRAKGFAEAQAADFVLRMGPLGTSKAVSGWVASAGRRVLVDADAAPLDAERRPSEIVRADPATLCGELAELIEARGPSPWLETWLDADRRARRAIDDELDRIGAPSEPGAARDLTAGLPDGATLVVASSMPVRDIDWFMRPREGVRVLANRGANGIDGFVSTTIGVALSSHGPVVALCGDLSLLHDSNGLLPRGRGRANAVFVVLNNDGGGVFSFLPQASEERFEELFATPQGIDLEVLARLHGCGYCRVTDRPSLVPAVLRALDDPGVHLVEVRTERAENLELHNRLWQAAARTAR